MVKNNVPNGLVPAILLVGATLLLVFVRAFSPLGDGWSDILGLLPLYVGAVALVAVAGYWYNRYARARDKRLARDHPGAVVFGSQMTPALRMRLKTGPELRGRIPNLYTVVADSTGIGFWSGGASNPSKFWAIDWKSVVDIHLDTFQLEYRRARGIRIETTDEPANGALEVVALNQGMFASSLAKPEVGRLADDLQKLHNNSGSGAAHSEGNSGLG